MIEVTLLNYLKTALGVPVYLEDPVSSGSYVVLELTGGGCNNHINTAVFAIQSYDDSLYKASVLNDKVKKAMEDLESEYELGITKAELNSAYNYSDTTKKRYRYQAVYDLVYTE